MSDFLTNLLGRSLGTLEVVRPRVPSLYEPYRRGTGLLGANPGLPAHDTPSEPQRESSLENAANPVPHHQNPRLRTSSPARDSRQAKNESQAEPVKVSDPPDRPDPVPPHGVPKTITFPGPIATIQVPIRHDQASPPSAPPVSQQAAFDLNLPASRTSTHGTSLIAAPPGDTLRNSPEVNHPSAKSPEVTRPGLVRPVRPQEDMKAEASSSQMGHINPAKPSPEVIPSLTAHQISPVSNALRSPTAPTKAGHQEPGAVRPPIAPSIASPKEPSFASAIRPPVAPRATNARSPEALPSSSPPAPAIQVSIGRVEVRAVFPQPAVHSAPAPRPTPPLSLDEYLQQRNQRGKR